MHNGVCVRVSECVCACVHACMHTCIRVCVCMRACMHACVFMHLLYKHLNMKKMNLATKRCIAAAGSSKIKLHLWEVAIGKALSVCSL